MARFSTLQDPYLNALRRDKVAVAIYLVNGIKLQGIIEGFDSFSLLLKSNTQQLVYKHGISTIRPLKNYRFYEERGKKEGNEEEGKQEEKQEEVNDSTSNDLESES